MTLTRNKDYNWGPTPSLDEITVRYISDSSAQIQALKNGEADIIAPQASADTVSQLQALSSQGVTMDKGAQLSYDHLDLNYSGPFKDKNVREAFMKTIPRTDIVNKIIKPLDPSAKPLDSQIFVPAQAGYADSVKNNGSANFQSVDIDGAKKLLNGATPEVKIMYNKDNPNRLDAYTLIAQSAAKAGFKVVDGGLGKSEWGSALGNGTYDASIFGWINSGVGGQRRAADLQVRCWLELQQVLRPAGGPADGRADHHHGQVQAGNPGAADRPEDLGFGLRAAAVPGGGR